MSAVHAYGFGRAILLAKSAIDLAENEGLATEPAKNFASRGPHEGHRLASIEECVMNIALAVILVALMVPALIFLARDLERSRRNSEQIRACAREIQEAAALSAEVIAQVDAGKDDR